MKKQNGITLISLIITIIIMLILAGVSLSMVMGDGSMLDQANAAATKTKLAEVQEYVDLATASNKMAKYSGMGLKSKDTLVTEMAEQGLITNEEKEAVLGGADLEVNGTKIEFTELESSYNDAINAGVTEGGENDEGTVLKGTWKLNDTLNCNTDIIGTHTISFTSNGIEYTSMRLFKTLGMVDGYHLSYNDTEVYSLMENLEEYPGDEPLWWLGEEYKTINFGNVSQEVSQEFYDWFTANATRN